MILFNKERLLKVSKEKWEIGGNQRFADMTISDVEKHKDVVRKKMNMLTQEAEAGEVATIEDPLSNIKEVRKNRVYLMLLCKKANELQELLVGDQD